MVELEVIFPQLTAEDRRGIEAIAECLRVPAGTVLVEEGSVSDAIFLVRDGVVTVTKAMGAAEVVVAELTAGEVVGEISFVDGGALSATVTASTGAEVLKLSKRDLQSLAERTPALGMRLYRSLAATLAQRLREMTDRYSVSVP